MTRIFDGITFYVNLDGIGGSLSVLLNDSITTLGGVLSEYLCTGVGYAVLRHMQQPEYQQAAHAGMPIVSPNWVLDCGSAATLLPVPKDHKPYPGPAIPSFNEHVQEVSVSEIKGPDRCITSYRIECTGAKFNKQYNGRTITHLVVRDLQASSPKVEAALSQDIPVVTIAYIDACLTAWEYLPADPYRRPALGSDSRAEAAAAPPAADAPAAEAPAAEAPAAAAAASAGAVPMPLASTGKAAPAAAPASTTAGISAAVLDAPCVSGRTVGQSEEDKQGRAGIADAHGQAQPAAAHGEVMLGCTVLQEWPQQQAAGVHSAASREPDKAAAGGRQGAGSSQAEDSQQVRPKLDALINGLTAHLDAASPDSPPEQQPHRPPAAATAAAAAAAAAAATTGQGLHPAVLGAYAGPAALRPAVPWVAGLSKRRGPRASASSDHTPLAAAPASLAAAPSVAEASAPDKGTGSMDQAMQQQQQMQPKGKPASTNGQALLVQPLPTALRVSPEPEGAIAPAAVPDMLVNGSAPGHAEATAGAQQTAAAEATAEATAAAAAAAAAAKANKGGPPAKQQKQQKKQKGQQQAAAPIPGLDLTELDPTAALEALVPKVAAPGHAAFTGALAALPAAAGRGGRATTAHARRSSTPPAAAGAVAAGKASAGHAAATAGVAGAHCEDGGAAEQQQQQQGGRAKRQKLALQDDGAVAAAMPAEGVTSPVMQAAPAAAVPGKHNAGTVAKRGCSRARKQGAGTAAPAQQNAEEDEEPQPLRRPLRQPAGSRPAVATSDEQQPQHLQTVHSHGDQLAGQRDIEVSGGGVGRVAGGKRVAAADSGPSAAQAKRQRAEQKGASAARQQQQQAEKDEESEEEESEQQEAEPDEQEDEQDAAAPPAANAQQPLQQQPARIALSGMHTRERDQSAAVLARLRVSCLKSKHQWQAGTTHIVMPDLRRYEKSVCGLAAGVWLLRAGFLDACKAAGRLLGDPLPYELHDGVNGAIADGAPAHWRARREATGAGAFAGLQVILYGTMPDSPGPSQAVLRRLVNAGGGKVVATCAPFKPAVLKAVNGVAKVALVADDKTKSDKCVKQLLAAGVPCCSPQYLMDFLAQPWKPLTAHYRFGSASPELKDLEEERGRDPRPQEHSMSF